VTRARFAVLALVLAAIAYPLAAFQAPPGFYEGFCPPVDYRFLKPPPQVNSTKPPGSAHTEIKVVNGVVQPGYVATADDNPQAQLSFVPGAFAAPTNGSNVVVIDIKPVAGYPDPKGLTLVTNVYQVTSSTPMMKTSNLRLLYSTLLPAPSSIYVAQEGGEWQALPSNPSTQTGCSDIVSQINTTGYFAAGFPSGSSGGKPASTVGGGQALPIIVALAILIVILAGIPLAMVRRRRAGVEAETGKKGQGPRSGRT
jgi:hypothetical protein